MAETVEVVVLGASGMGREALDVIDAMCDAGADISVLGVLDDAPDERHLQRLAERNVSYLGKIAPWLAEVAPVSEEPGSVHYVVGIGSPVIRRRLAALCDRFGLIPLSVVHPRATLGSNVSLGEGSLICAGAAISTNVRLGAHCHVNPNATINHDACLGDFVSVGSAAAIAGEVCIGESSLVGAGAVVLTQLQIGAGVVIDPGVVISRDIVSTSEDTQTH